MLIFLDTEFTSFNEPYLVSAGLVAGASEFYFEVAGVSPAICSPFVEENVLPLLSGSALQPIEIAQNLGAFLEPYRFDVTFFCSAPRYDIELLRPFLPARLRWRFAVPSFDDPTSQELFEVMHEGAFASGLRRHHALDDARALSISWNAHSSRDKLVDTRSARQPYG